MEFYFRCESYWGGLSHPAPNRTWHGGCIMGLAKSAEIIRKTIKKVSKEILALDFGSGARAWPWSVDLGLEVS